MSRWVFGWLGCCRRSAEVDGLTLRVSSVLARLGGLAMRDVEGVGRNCDRELYPSSARRIRMAPEVCFVRVMF